MSPFRYFQVYGHPLRFTPCQCGEHRPAALKRRLLDKQPICRNCTSKHRYGLCFICNRVLPIEQHHIAGRKHTETVNLCVNCHACCTYIQTKIKHHDNLFTGYLILGYVFFTLNGKNYQLLESLKKDFYHE